jgi:hypothetical protein
MIGITLDDREVREALSRLQRRLSDMLAEAGASAVVNAAWIMARDKLAGSSCDSPEH